MLFRGNTLSGGGAGPDAKSGATAGPAQGATPPGTARAPSTEVPLKPEDVTTGPSAGDIATQVARRLIVPKGPRRQIFTGLIRLDQSGNTPVLGGPGILRAVNIQSGAVHLTASQRSTSIVCLGDGNFDKVLTFAFDIILGSAGDLFSGNIPIAESADLDLMFANGININVNVVNNNYGGASYFWGSLIYESIPIGQRIGA